MRKGKTLEQLFKEYSGLIKEIELNEHILSHATESKRIYQPAYLRKYKSFKNDIWVKQK